MEAGLEARAQAVEAAVAERIHHLLEGTVEPACEGGPVHLLPGEDGETGRQVAQLLGELLPRDVQVHADPQDEEAHPGRLGVELHQDPGGLAAGELREMIAQVLADVLHDSDHLAIRGSQVFLLEGPFLVIGFPRRGRAGRPMPRPLRSRTTPSRCATHGPGPARGPATAPRRTPVPWPCGWSSSPRPPRHWPVPRRARVCAGPARRGPVSRARVRYPPPGPGSDARR